MKFFTAIILAAAAVNAVALPEPEANPQIIYPPGKGQFSDPCKQFPRRGCPNWPANITWKRGASPEADAEAAACDAPGQPCWVVKRAAEAFSDVMGEENLSTRQINCKKPFQPCWKAKRTAEAFAEALASAQEDSSDFTASLNLERRFSEPEITETTVEARSPQIPCKKPFQPCWKAKRAAEAEADAACNMPGEPCHVVKRAAEAVNDLIARTPQIGCWKKPFQPCYKAKREVAKLQNFARFVLEVDQE